MTNPNKIYDTTPNLNHLKSQLISTTSNAYTSVNYKFNLRNLPNWNQVQIYQSQAKQTFNQVPLQDLNLNLNPSPNLNPNPNLNLQDVDVDVEVEDQI